MKPVSFLLVIFCLLAPPLLATDGDFYKGLNWTEVEPGETIYMLGISPSTLPEDIKDYRVLAPEDYRTRYGRVLGHVMLADGSWLQETLVADGKAIVMPIYERDEVRLQSLLTTEDEARAARRGLWQKSPVICAWGAKRAFDTFAIIQGPIIEAANVRGTIYLNFGEDYRKDFTIKITRSIFNKLPEETQNIITRWAEGPESDSVPVRVVEARGWVFYSGGPMIEVKAPAQIRFLEDSHPNQIERCTS